MRPPMAYEFKLPDLGEGLTEGEIARWLVAEGQEIAEDDPLVEIQTDKTTVEIPSPAAGTVARILAAEGEVVPVGAVIVVIGDGAREAVGTGEPPGYPEASSPGQSPQSQPTGGFPDESQTPPPRAGERPDQAGTAGREGVRGSEPQTRNRPADRSGQAAATGADRASGSEPQSPTRLTGPVRATPLVRRIAHELGVELASVPPSAPGGRVTEEDVRAAAASRETPGEPASEGRRVPLRGVRRLIAEHMTRAREVPAVTWVEECDFTGIDLQLLVPTVLKACAESLREHPHVNARFEGDAIVLFDRYDLGIAVDTDDGLLVPVVRDCDVRSIEELADEVRRLADAAREGTLAPGELRGSTFTVTSAGKFAGLFQTPIVNHPEVAILSVGRIAERPAVRDGALVARRIGYVAVTFDHRALDGKQAAAFGLEVIRRLEAVR
jgi:pyruvate/2-oxoglutarate dehydrogenase complex dihydrolipoamide acyltransferase (E2) component